MQCDWDSIIELKSPQTFPASDFKRPGVDALFFENMPFHGKQTRVFAWVGVPYLKPGQTCPAMVLLHGGGGTAYDEWVRLWNRRGYAAIAIDQCGCIPPDGDVNGEPHERHEYGGPPGWDASFHDVRSPVTDQWPFHAVSAAIRAHTLLAAMPEVDPDRIGVTGISWGGYLTCLLAAADPRLKCAVPVYGCGYLGDDSAWKDTVFPDMDGDDVDRWLAMWDPSVFLPQARQPFCWVSGTNDFAFFLVSLRKSYRLTSHPTRCIRVEMAHSHADGWAPEEIGVFVDSVLRDGAPLIGVGETIIETVGGDPFLAVDFESSRPLMSAEFAATRATGYWPDRKYNVLNLELDESLEGTRHAGRLRVAVPPKTTVCCMNLIDDRGCISSSDIIIV